MITQIYLLLFFISCGSNIVVESSKQQPHIIVIVADDLGWNDVGFHGSSQIPTPNIDALAYDGVILNNYYVQPICTPSRSAFMSGMHPIHTGMQHGVISGAEPYGLPLHHTLLPQYLNRLGYTSRHVGKWHLGFFEKEYTPTFRGFHSHYGYWSGRVDYYSRTALENPGYWGYDFHRNMKTDRSEYGLYTTDIFTRESVRIIRSHNASQPLFLYLAHLAVHSGNPYDPLQAPSDVIEKFSHIKDVNRRKFAAMLSKLDESVGVVIKALKEAKMLENSLILFTTDNGGPAAGFNLNAASNWPLRGVKATMWEGGMRGAAFMWSHMLKNPGRVSTDMIQIIDWLPTLYAAAGGNVSDLDPIDGINMWPTIKNEISSPRIKMLHNIDPTFNGWAVRVGDWKLISNPSNYGLHWDQWFGPSGRPKNQALYRRLRISEMMNSNAAKAIRHIHRRAHKNIYKVVKDTEVLCGPVPNNATKHCNKIGQPCLFQISSDPCEYHDVSEFHGEKVKELQKILSEYNATAILPGNKKKDPLGNPKYWNYEWINWKDYTSSHN